MGGCIKRLANCALFLLIAVAMALAVAYYYLLPRLDDILADAVRREFLLPPSSTVGITRGTLLDTLEGEVKGIYVSSPEAKISDLTVADLDFQATGIRFDLARTLASGQAQLTEVTSGELNFKVSEEALETRWAAELSKKGLTQTDVTLENDLVSVSCVLDLKLTKVRLGATGELQVDGTDRIRFKATDLELAGSSIGIDELKAVFSTLTPVIDLGQFKMSVAIDDVQMREGYLYIAARSMSPADKLALEETRRQAATEAEESAVGGKRFKLPSLEELTGIFIEETDPKDAGEEGQEVEGDDPSPKERDETGDEESADEATEGGEDGDADAEDDEAQDQRGG